MRLCDILYKQTQRFYTPPNYWMLLNLSSEVFSILHSCLSSLSCNTNVSTGLIGSSACFLNVIKFECACITTKENVVVVLYSMIHQPWHPQLFSANKQTKMKQKKTNISMVGNRATNHKHGSIIIIIVSALAR